MGSWVESLRIAARALTGHAFRSSLTVLSIMVGAFAIVLMSSLADGGRLTIKKGIEELGGARLLFVSPRAPVRASPVLQSAYPRGFGLADRDAVFTDMPHVVERCTYGTPGLSDVSSDEGKTVRSDFVAADAGMLHLLRMPVGRGITFTEEDNRAHAQVCVIGPKTAQKLFTGEPLGRMLNVRGGRCRVIAVLADNDRFGVNFGFDWEDLVLMPFEAAADLVPDLRGSAELVLKSDDPASNDVIKRIVNARMKERRHGVDDFEIFDFARVMESFDKIFVITEAIVGLISGIALFIGGIGVMNMMLVSVSERVREIGIRKALGATPADIGRQFIAESLLLSGGGGLVGVAAGAAGALGAELLIHHFMKAWVVQISTPAALIALAVSVGVGVVFGYFPARRAAGLDPIEAMRR